jgi:hexosaminidase
MSLELSPMLWGYMENVREYFRPELFEKYGRVFERIWIATAYKGAQGELASLTNIESRYKNHVSWLDVMEEKVSKNILKFSGVALTGWSRYDHFLALCELLPQALPSLVFNLKVLQVGPLSDSAKYEVWSKLGCKRPIPWYGATDAYGAIECTNLPGYEVYDALLPLENTLKLQDSVEFAKKYMTPLNLDYNYLHKMRSIEVLNRLTREYFMLNIHRNIFLHACQNMYFEETGKEWIAVYLAPYLDTVYELMMRIKNLTEKNDWSPRPLPVQLKQYPGF